MPLFRLFDPYGRTNLRSKRLLVIGEEQPIKDIKIGTDGIGVDILVIHFLHIVFQRFIRNGRTLVPRQRTQQQAHLGGIAFHIIDSVYIVFNNGVQIFSRQQTRPICRRIQIARPAAPHDVGNQVPEIHISGHDRRKFSFAQVFQRYLSRRFSGFVQRHGSHSQSRDPAGTAV